MFLLQQPRAPRATPNPSLERPPVHDLFEMADERQHREHRLDEHTVLPRAALTPFQVGGVAFRGMKAGVAQDNHALFNLANEPLKGIIRDECPWRTMHCLTKPPFFETIVQYIILISEKLQGKRQRCCFISLTVKSWGLQQLVSKTRLINQSLILDNIMSL